MSEIRKTSHNITLEGAKRVRDRALVRASELGISISVVIADRMGVLLLVETADSAAPGAVEASLMKAKGAARYGTATHLTTEYLKTIPPALVQHALSLPDVCAFQGGVGISGGSGEQDIAIAFEAAADIK